MVSSSMNAEHRRALEAIFARPVTSGLRWTEIESLLVALGSRHCEPKAKQSTTKRAAAAWIASSLRSSQ
jgi:hypothetical protein